MEIGGAYSVDKYFRLARGYTGMKVNNQVKKTKNKIVKVLKDLDNKIDIILSHTCPYKHLPREMFLEGVDQRAVDNTTELMYFKGLVENSHIKIFESNDKNNKGDFVITISMKGGK